MALVGNDIVGPKVQAPVDFPFKLLRANSAAPTSGLVVFGAPFAGKKWLFKPFNFNKKQLLYFAISLVVLLGTFVAAEQLSKTSNQVETGSSVQESVKPKGLRSYVRQSVALKFGDTKILASTKVKSRWFKAKGVIISVNKKALGHYLDDLAKAYARSPHEQIYSVASDGAKTILVQGVSGFSLDVNASVVNKLSKLLLIGDKTKFTIPSHHIAFSSIAINGFGDKLLEANISTKRMYAYENGELVKTFLITAGAPATPTATGDFSIYSKVRIQDMKGFNADGTKYFQPDVEWVSYFNGSDAIHGNYWRPLSYFGSVNSSHGCLGIINSEAQWVYYWAPIGTKVVVHK